MSKAKALPLSRAQKTALRTKLNAALGLPKTATEADRVGGGIHVPLERCVTLEAVEIIDLADDTSEALVPVELERFLSATDRTRLRAPTQREPSLALDALAEPADEAPVSR